MSIGNAPAMFVSSTCFDLMQVRSDLRDFITSLGIQPILSEYSSFPVNPDINAVDNCLKTVDQNADLFLLIIGGRYGSQLPDGKSITNMEYLRARAKGIPIYVFVHKSILNLLTVWKANPKGDFSAVVDTPKLFEFVTSLMDLENIWIFPFEFAQDITDTLRTQLAFLLMDSLNLRRQVRNTSFPESLLSLQGTSLRLAIEQPIAWEYRLFAHVFAQEIAKINQRKLDLKYGLAMGRAEYLRSKNEVLNWASRKFNEAGRIIDATNQIINIALQDALGPPGFPGDREMLVYVAKRLANAYEHSIEWSIECNQVGVSNEGFSEIVKVVGTFLDNAISEIERFSDNFIHSVEEALLNLPGDNEPPRIIRLTLTISGIDSQKFSQALDKFSLLNEDE